MGVGGDYIGAMRIIGFCLILALGGLGWLLTFLSLASPIVTWLLFERVDWSAGLFIWGLALLVLSAIFSPFMEKTISLMETH